MTTRLSDFRNTHTGKLTFYCACGNNTSVSVEKLAETHEHGWNQLVWDGGRYRLKPQCTCGGAYSIIVPVDTRGQVERKLNKP